MSTKSTSQWHYGSSIVAGTAAAIVTHPIDVVKTRLQSVTWQQQGLRAIVCTKPFSGLSMGIFSYMPSKAISLGTFNTIKQKLAKHDFFIGRPDFLLNVISGTFTGSVVALSMCPLYVLKTHKQLVGKNQKTSLDIAKMLWSETGIKGFYRGLGVSLFGCSEIVAQLVMYEHFKKSGWVDKVLTSSSVFENISKAALVGAGSKMFSTVIFYPQDVIRTRLRENSKLSFSQTIKGMYKEKGLVSFYRGLVPQLLKSTTSSAILFGIYDWLINL